MYYIIMKFYKVYYEMFAEKQINQEENNASIIVFKINVNQRPLD